MFVSPNSRKTHAVARHGFPEVSLNLRGVFETNAYSR